MTLQGIQKSDAELGVDWLERITRRVAAEARDTLSLKYKAEYHELIRVGIIKAWVSIQAERIPPRWLCAPETNAMMRGLMKAYSPEGSDASENYRDGR